MNARQVLEDRAERGVSRGAATVWAQAHVATSEPDSAIPRLTAARSGFWFRVAVGLSALLLAAIAFVSLGEDPTSLIATDGPENDEQTDDTPGFEQVLIQGMDLVTVQRPFDPAAVVTDGDSDGFLDRIFGPGEEVITDEATPVAAGTLVFAHPDDPFNNPIVGVENMGDGGFRPFGINLGTEPLETYVNQLTSQDGTWTIAPETGLVQVDIDDGQLFSRIRSGWEITFRSGPDQATLLVEPAKGRGVWVWLTRTMRTQQSQRTSLATTDIEVLGRRGVLVTYVGDADGEGQAFDQLFWDDGQYVYRLSASRASDIGSIDAQASDLLDRLVVADHATWQAAVNEAEGSSNWVWGVLAALIAAGLVLWLTLHRRRQKR